MKKRNIDVWWGLGNNRDSVLVKTIAEGKKVMRCKLKEGEESIVMYDQVFYEQGRRVNDDPETTCYFFNKDAIKSDKL